MGPTTAASMTPQGQATNSLQQALSQMAQNTAAQGGLDPSTAVSNAVTNTANIQQPQDIQTATQQLQQSAGIPALQSQQQNLGQIFQMYLADQNLASKYASPTLASGNSPIYGNQSLNTQGQGIANMGSANTFNDPYLSSPTALVNAIMGQPNSQGQYGFQGFSTPGQNTAEMEVVPNAATNAINALQTGINSSQQLADTNLSNYENKYNTTENMLNTLLTNQAANAFSMAQPGTTQYNLRMAQQAQSDIQSGRMTLLNALQKYTGVLDPTTIFNLYTRYNHGTGKSKVGYGDPIETPELLSSYGINLPSSYIKQKQSEDTQNLAAKNTLDTIQQMQDSFNQMSEIEKLMPSSIASKFPGMFPNKAALDTQFYTQLESDLRKSAIGGRITQAEMQWIKNAVLPQPTDTNSSYALRVNKVKDSITKKLQNPDYLIGSPSGDTGSGGGSTSNTSGGTWE